MLSMTETVGSYKRIATLVLMCPIEEALKNAD